MRLSRNDIIFTTINIIIILLLSWLLYWHVNLRAEAAANAKQVGTVRYKYHIVMRKFVDRLIWENVDPETPVYMYDSIMTKDLSDAELKLNSGVKLALDANSMVQLDMIGEKLGVKLKSGTVHSHGNSEEEVFIGTEDGTVVDISKGEVTLAKGKDDLQVNVKSGHVIISKNSKNTRVPKGRQVKLDKQGNISVKEVNIETSEPADGSLLVSDSDYREVSFKIKNNTGLENPVIRLSRSGDLKNAKTVSVSSSGETEAVLRQGTWYWQVEGKRNGKTEVSQLQTVKIRPAEKITVYTPGESEVVKSDEGSPGVVRFRWRSPSSGLQTRFKLSKNADMQPLLKTEKTSSTSMLFDDLEQGTYYWQIESLHTDGQGEKVIGSSAVTEFHVGSPDKDKQAENEKTKEQLVAESISEERGNNTAESSENPASETVNGGETRAAESGSSTDTTEDNKKAETAANADSSENDNTRPESGSSDNTAESNTDTTGSNAVDTTAEDPAPPEIKSIRLK